ncbi:aminoglycoside phosphotransferase family protein [Luteococcus sediminum]
MGIGDEEVLAGGNASGRVVRIGDTVHKPWLPTTSRMISYLAHLEAAGLDVPHVHGRDSLGRVILDYVPGSLAMDRAPLDLATIERVGSLVRRTHDASATFPVDTAWGVLLPASEPDLVCHNDLATWNLVIDGDRLVFIDWDGAGPSSRLWDLAYSAIAFAHLFPGADVVASADRLRCFVAGYDADDDLRVALPEALERRSQAMWSHLEQAHSTGHEPWATMFREGHGEHWAGTTRFIATHRDEWHRAVQRSTS